MKAVNFDKVNPPELSTINDKTVLQFNKLPPSNKNPNPLYRRLEILIGNKVGYQYKVKKSEDNLTYEINTTNEFVQSEIIDLLNSFHSNSEYSRYDNREEFISAKEVKTRIKEQLISRLNEFQFKSKSQNKIAIQKDGFIFTIEWSFLQGDASREFNFNWRISSEEITQLHNEIISESDLSSTKELSLLAISQYYDKSNIIERSFDVANTEEVDASIKKYIIYLDDEILNQIRSGLKIEDLEKLITKRVSNNLYRFPERSHYILGLLNFKHSPAKSKEILNKVNIESIVNTQEKQKIEYLKQRIASS